MYSSRVREKAVSDAEMEPSAAGVGGASVEDRLVRSRFREVDCLSAELNCVFCIQGEPLVSHKKGLILRYLLHQKTGEDRLGDALPSWATLFQFDFYSYRGYVATVMYYVILSLVGRLR